MEINIQNLLSDKVNIAVIQLESPFFDEMKKSIQRINNDDIYDWAGTDIIDERRKKIINILNEIKKEREDIHVIVFPEYTIPLDIINQIEDFSNSNNVLIIAGSDQVRNHTDPRYKRNVCPVIVPNDKTYYVEKHHLSEPEKGVVKQGQSANSVLNIKWSFDNKEFSLQILLCLDYVEYYNRLKINKETKGIIVVPMCTNNLDDFATSVYLRRGKFVIFCNAVDLKYSKTGKMIGHSAIHGGKRLRDGRGAIVSTDDNNEAVLMAELNVANPTETSYKQLGEEGIISPSSRERIYIIDHDQKKNSYKLRLYSSDEDTLAYGKNMAIINPNVYKNAMMKLLRFSFLRSLKYTEFKYKLKDDFGEDSDALGIIGDYDAVIFHFLNPNESLKVEEKLEKTYLLRKEVSLEVEKIFKFFSYPVFDISRKGLISLNDPIVLKKMFSLCKDWDTPDSKDDRDKFLEENLILGKYKQVDFKEGHQIRAFLCISIEEHSHTQVNLFENQIISKYFMARSCVDSIYKTKGTAGFKCHYLFDIVALPHKLFDLILGIHKRVEEFSIEIYSVTYIIVEQLSHSLLCGPLLDQINIIESIDKEIKSINDILKEGESDNIEFKSSLRWDYTHNRANKNLEIDIVKAIAGFANSNGGYLLIGVSDDKKILGIEKDFDTLGKKNRDGFELHLINIVRKHLGTDAIYLTTIKFDEIEEKLICKIKIDASSSNMPIYLTKENRQEFFVRMGNSTRPLGVREANQYLKRRFKDH